MMALPHFPYFARKRDSISLTGLIIDGARVVLIFNLAHRLAVGGGAPTPCTRRLVEGETYKGITGTGCRYLGLRILSLGGQRDALDRWCTLSKLVKYFLIPVPCISISILKVKHLLKPIRKF